MSENSAQPPAQAVVTPDSRRRAPALVAPLALWIALQMTALLLAAGRVPFSARYPVPEESLAVHLMVIVQIAASALLFPFLFRSVTATLALIATTVPFIQLATFLAAQSDNLRIGLSATYVAGWLTALALVNAPLRSDRAKMYSVALATLLALGGAASAYLDREFGAPAATFDWSSFGACGPIMGCLAILEANPKAGTIWLFLGSVLVLALAAFGIARWRSKKRNPSRKPAL